MQYILIIKFIILAPYINIYVLLMTILQRTKVPNIYINVAQVGPKTPQTCTYTLYIYISIYAEAICKRWAQELSRTRSFREVLEHQLRISPPSFSSYWAGPRKCAMPEIYIKYDFITIAVSGYMSFRHNSYIHHPFSGVIKMWPNSPKQGHLLHASQIYVTHAIRIFVLVFVPIWEALRFWLCTFSMVVWPLVACCTISCCCHFCYCCCPACSGIYYNVFNSMQPYWYSAFILIIYIHIWFFFRSFSLVCENMLYTSY